ncbi:hypothetical protein ENT52713_13330 [Enterobacter sp. 200527-13]|nr:hypothetical protein ENT52713_13330 [Enterobacter sp. 200527-13]
MTRLGGFFYVRRKRGDRYINLVNPDTGRKGREGKFSHTIRSASFGRGYEQIAGDELTLSSNSG